VPSEFPKGGFNDKQYTEDSILKQLVLIENHATDNSILTAGCHCVEGKHLFALEGYSDEGVNIMAEPQKKEFLVALGALARSLRRNMESDKWSMRDVLHEAGLNPSARAYLPSGLTAAEKHSKLLLSHLSSCIKQAEINCCGHHTTDYSKCKCNPVAVCRASIEK